MSGPQSLSVVIVCYPTYGGSGIVATELGKGLADRGVLVHFVCYEPPRRLLPIPKGVFYHPVHVVSYPLFRFPPYTLSLTSALIDVIEKHSPDLIHCHYAIPHSISARLARDLARGGGSPSRLITTLHGTDIELSRRDPSFSRLIACGLTSSHGVTAVSNALKEETEEAFPALKDRITVIPNFVDTDQFQPGKRTSLRKRFAEPGEFLLIHCSNFRPLKRTADVAAVFAEVARRLPARLLLIGDGPDLPKSVEKLSELGVRNRVCVLKDVRRVEKYLPTGDLFLLPSQREAFGLAALEAMSCGLPVVASNVEGLAELVQDGVTGYLHPVGDVKTAAERCLAILSDPKTRQSLSTAARQRAVDQFPLRKGIDSYLSYYQSVLEEEL